jgi:hypothetical protein
MTKVADYKAGHAKQNWQQNFCTYQKYSTHYKQIPNHPYNFHWSPRSKKSFDYSSSLISEKSPLGSIQKLSPMKLRGIFTQTHDNCDGAQNVIFFLYPELAELLLVDVPQPRFIKVKASLFKFILIRKSHLLVLHSFVHYHVHRTIRPRETLTIRKVEVSLISVCVALREGDTRLSISVLGWLMNTLASKGWTKHLNGFLDLSG